MLPSFLPFTTGALKVILFLSSFSYSRKKNEKKNKCLPFKNAELQTLFFVLFGSLARSLSELLIHEFN